MSALSQWPSFESFIYSGSLSKLLHRSVIQCRRVLLSVLLVRNHNMYFRFVFCTKSHNCPPFSGLTKTAIFPFCHFSLKFLFCIYHCTKTYNALIMHSVHLSDTAVISYLMIALFSPLFSSLHGH